MTWINTYTGRKVFPLDLTPNDICLKDVAHALAGRMRYMAHCWISVAQHSIVVARCIQLAGGDDDLVRYGLFHDAHEAYFPDMPRPLKSDPRMAWFLEIEDKAQAIVLEALGVPLPSKEDMDRVQMIDIMVCGPEARSGFSSMHPEWVPMRIDKRLESTMRSSYMSLWDPTTAERRFLDTARRLGVKG